MSRHVDRLLAACVNGQLLPGDASRVYEHLRGCRSCRARLAAYEQMSADLQTALGRQLSARPDDVQRWWRAISRPARPPVRPNRALVVAPALIVVAALGLPLLASLSSMVAQPATTGLYANATHAGTQLAANQPAAGLIPQPEQQDQTTAMVATAAPQENVLTAAPAPLAPSTQ